MALGPVPLVVHSLHPGDRHSGPAALVDAFGLRGFNARLLPLADEPALHFGDHAQYRDQDGTSGVLGRNRRGTWI
jgi:hypothetical protein